MARKVIAYVDGFNLYYGISDAGLRRFLWLDIPKMVRGILLPDQTLMATRYFTSRIARPPASVKRQTNYIEALETLPGVRVTEGRYDGEPSVCKRCGKPVGCQPCGVQHTSHNEKMTDVAIATSVVRDAYDQSFDTAVIVTGDADQVPTVELIRDCFKDKRVVALFPPKRVSRHLALASHVNLNINEAMLRSAQLPDVIVKAGGVLLGRPSEWAEISN